MRNPAADEEPSTRCDELQTIELIGIFLLRNFKKIRGAAFVEVAKDSSHQLRVPAFRLRRSLVQI
jgi:hypothetical protein